MFTARRSGSVEQLRVPVLDGVLDPSDLLGRDSRCLPAVRCDTSNRSKSINECRDCEPAILLCRKLEQAPTAILFPESNHIDEVTWLGACPKRQGLVRGKVVLMQYRPDVHDNARLQAPAVWKDFHLNRVAGRWLYRNEPILMRRFRRLLDRESCCHECGRRAAIVNASPASTSVNRS